MCEFVYVRVLEKRKKPVQRAAGCVRACRTISGFGNAT